MKSVYVKLTYDFFCDLNSLGLSEWASDEEIYDAVDKQLEEDKFKIDCCPPDTIDIDIINSII